MLETENVTSTSPMESNETCNKEIKDEQIFKTNKLVNDLLEKNVDLLNQVNQLEKQLKSSKLVFEQELNSVRNSIEENNRISKSKEAKAILSLNLALNENQIITSELTSLRIAKNDIEAKFLSANELVENANHQFQKVNVTIENWKYKYKCLKEKIYEVTRLDEKVSSKIKLVLEANENLKTINAHHKTVVELMQIEKRDLNKDFESKIAAKNEEIEKLVSCLNDLKIQNISLNQHSNQVNEKIKILEQELDLATQKNKEYSEQIKKTFGQIGLTAQSLIDQEKHVKMLENSLKEKSDQILTHEKEKQDLIDNINNLKISKDFDLNELNKEIKNLNLKLNNETDEKNSYKEKFSELNEVFYILQLNMKDLIEETNKIKSKKFYNSYTQTVTAFNYMNNEVTNKIVQTDETNFVTKRHMFTQTIDIPTMYNNQQKNENNFNAPKVIASRSSTTSSIFERLTGIDFNKNLHLIPKKSKNVEKNNDSEEEKRLSNKSYANKNLNYEKFDHGHYFNDQLNIIHEDICSSKKKRVTFLERNQEFNEDIE